MTRHAVMSETVRYLKCHSTGTSDNIFLSSQSFLHCREFPIPCYMLITSILLLEVQTLEHDSLKFFGLDSPLVAFFASLLTKFLYSILIFCTYWISF